MHRFGEPPPSPSRRFLCPACLITPAAARPPPHVATTGSWRLFVLFGRSTQQGHFLSELSHRPARGIHFKRPTLDPPYAAPGLPRDACVTYVTATTHSPHPHPPLPYCRDRRWTGYRPSFPAGSCCVFSSCSSYSSSGWALGLPLEPALPSLLGRPCQAQPRPASLGPRRRPQVRRAAGACIVL